MTERGGRGPLLAAVEARRGRAGPGPTAAAAGPGAGRPREPPPLPQRLAMDSDEGYNYEFDEDEECSEDSGAEEDEEDEEEDEPDDNLDLGEVELVEPGLRVGGERDGLLGSDTGGLGPGGGGGGGGLGGGPGPGGGPEQEEDYRYEVLTAEQILQHMVECIREVNEVIQVRPPGTGTGGDTGGKGRGVAGRASGLLRGTGPGPAAGQGLTRTCRCCPGLEGRGGRLLSVHSEGGGGSPSPRSPGRPLGPGRDLASCCGSVGNEAFGTERVPLSLCGCELGAVIYVFFFILLRPHGVWWGVAPAAPSVTPGVHGKPWNSRRGTALVLLPSPFPPPPPATHRG